MRKKPIKPYLPSRVRRNRVRTTGVRMLLLLLAVLLGGSCLWFYIQTGQFVPRMEYFTGRMSAHFIDVGQGDATLLLTPEHAVCIDAGPGSHAAETLAYVKTYTGRLDGLLLTHPHEDHIGGAVSLLESLSISTLLLPRVDCAETDTLCETAAREGTEIVWIEPMQTWRAGEIQCTFLGPQSVTHTDGNNNSAVVRVEMGGIAMLFTGDAEMEAEEEILDALAPDSLSLSLLDCDLYQVGHHGSSTSTSLAFFLSMSPEIAVISCGRGNSYGHPHRETMQLFAENAVTVYRTDQMGNIVFHIRDGKISPRL